MYWIKKQSCAKAIVLALLLFALFASKASAETVVSDCMYITSPGVYVLNQSITKNQPVICIVIASSDVIFDGKEYTISGPDPKKIYQYMCEDSVAIEIYAYNKLTSNITIKNITVTNWGWGICSENPYNVVYNGNYKIENITATSNNFGIFLNARCDISNSNTGSNEKGIYIFNTENSIISNNTVTSNIGGGIHIEVCNDTTISNNTVISNGDGISLNNGYFSNLVKNNYLNSNQRGIVAFSGESILINNTVENSYVWDFISATGYISSLTTASNFKMGSTIVSFKSKDIALKNATPPAYDPVGYRKIGKYINAIKVSADSWIFLNISYSEADLRGLDENSLSLARHNGT